MQDPDMQQAEVAEVAKAAKAARVGTAEEQAARTSRVAPGRVPT